jgi:hypothetical protein
MAMDYSVRLDARRLKLLEERPQVFTGKDLQFPCNDSSREAKDFSQWSYFKKRDAEKVPIVNIKASHLWCDSLLDRINKHAEYQQYVEEPVATGYKGTKIAKMRAKLAKQQLARWRMSKAADTASESGATNGSTKSKGNFRARGQSSSRSPQRGRGGNGVRDTGSPQRATASRERTPSPTKKIAAAVGGKN